MKIFSRTFLWAFFVANAFAAYAFAAGKMFFRSPYILWQDPEILVWSPDSAAPMDSREFALSLKRTNGGIGNPSVRIAGEWERDSSAALYGAWLRNNLQPEIPAELLKARAQEVQKKIAGLEDKYLLYLNKDGNTLTFALFDESSYSPKAAGTVPYTADKVALGDAIAEMLFEGGTQRRLTAEERKKKAVEPNEYYSELPKFRAWVGIAGGYTQARVPFTPYSWYRRKLNSEIKNYRNTRDSLSAWNFLEDGSPLLNVYVGGTWYDFIGAEIFFRFSEHDAKIDERDTIYNELDYWKFYRFEIGISLMLSHRIPLHKNVTLIPHASVGFLYSFFSESIDTKSGYKPSGAYKSRIEFANFYKGAVLSIGAKSIFYDHYGIDLRAGLAGRGRILDREPSVDAVAEPTEIGGSTIDCFIQLGFEYHWSL